LVADHDHWQYNIDRWKLRLQKRFGCESASAASLLSDLTGKRQGMLTVISSAGIDGNGLPWWRCACDCGRDYLARTSPNNASLLVPCRCPGARCTPSSPRRRTRHGASSTPEYATWVSIRGRCLNRRHTRYAAYGGSGIQMWRPWQNSFPIFLADVGTRPRVGMRLMRLDQSGDYRPGNVLWATRQTEMSARDGTITIMHSGRAQTLGHGRGRWARATRRSTRASSDAAGVSMRH
jgi:hypothetical protein